MDLHAYFILKDFLENECGLTLIEPTGVGTNFGTVGWHGRYYGQFIMLSLPLNASGDITISMLDKAAPHGYRDIAVFHKNPSAVRKALQELHSLTMSGKDATVEV